ncbi:MAG: geranylgeranylglycerol-phosphate geranylgeranyltransferase [Candidatus Thorarchaeota archaeon]|jgi:geranylgeranylglycerol-phosphate geranylgeranyltransferase
MTEAPTDSESPSEKKIDPAAFLSIIRPQNCFIGSLTVIAGFLMGYKQDPILNLFDVLIILAFAYITYFTIAAGSNVVNDIYDIEIDKINRPHRALPSGRITIKQAWIYLAILSAIGLFFGVLTGPWSTVIVLAFVGIGYAYAAKVKTWGLAGNFMVAFSFAFGVLYGSFVYAEQTMSYLIPVPSWLFFFTAFMILQARETIKGAEDVEGDRIRDVRTIARVYGYNAAAGVAAILNLIGVVSYSLVWILGFASWDLWPLLILGSSIVLGAAIAPLTGPDDEKRLLIGSTLDKIGALVGLIAFVIIPLYGLPL